MSWFMLVMGVWALIVCAWTKAHSFKSFVIIKVPLYVVSLISIIVALSKFNWITINY